MREIKFRVWSKSYRGFTKQRMDFMHLSESKVIPIDNDGDLIWCQYTGLKDKNGVEIYEGDILKIDEHVVKVIFEKCCFFVDGFKNFTKQTLYQMFYYSNSDDIFEVIGNIYENSNLLGDNIEQN